MWKRSNLQFRSRPQAAKDLLKTTLKSLGIAEKVEKYSAFPHWNEIVGDSIARVAKPEKIVGGSILVIRVYDAAWAQELSLQKTILIEKLRTFGEGALVEDIRFVVGNPREWN